MIDFSIQIKEEEFNNKVLPFFKNIRFRYDTPFVLEAEEEGVSEEDYSYVFNSLFHGSLYRIACEIKGCELLYSEYLEFFNRNLIEYKVFGERVFTYLNEPILKLKTGLNKEQKIVEIIEPTYKPLIISDTEILVESGEFEISDSFLDYKNNTSKEVFNFESQRQTTDNKDSEEEFNLDDI